MMRASAVGRMAMVGTCNCINVTGDDERKKTEKQQETKKENRKTFLRVNVVNDDFVRERFIVSFALNLK